MHQHGWVWRGSSRNGFQLTVQTYFVFFFMKKPKPPAVSSPLLDEGKAFTPTPFPSPQDGYTFSPLDSSLDNRAVVPSGHPSLNRDGGDISPPAPSHRLSEGSVHYTYPTVPPSLVDSGEPVAGPVKPESTRNAVAAQTSRCVVATSLPPLVLATKALWERSRADEPVSATTPPPYSRLWGPQSPN